MAETIRVGFIGTGGNARGHIGRLAGIAGVQVAAFADPSEGALKAAQDRVKTEVPVFSDYEEMLDKTKLDAAVISTPHTLHFEQVMACLNRGLHVQVEKPMTCTSAHAREVIRKQKETGKTLLIGYQRHYDRRFRWARQQIADGAIGRVTLTHVYQGQNWLRNQQGKWRLDPDLSGGGQLNDSGSHVVDILLWMTDLEAEEAFAYVDNRGAEVDVNSAVSVRFTNGAVGTFTIVGDEVAGGMWEDITIAGDKGIIWIRQGGKLVFANESARRPTEVTDFSGVESFPGSKDGNFIDAIRGTAENQVPAICGLRVIELTEAVWRSAASGQPQKVEKS